MDERAESGQERIAPILKEWIGLLLSAMFWAILIYQFVFQVSEVKGSSMDPNIHHDDRLLIDKLAFRFRKIRPGEVVVFEAVVRDKRTGERIQRDFIKRVIAGPGDVVSIYDCKVHVNGVEFPEPWNPDDFGSDTERCPEVLSTPYVLPPERYFLLGDNRGVHKSEDSRSGYIGYVHRRQIKGKVRWRFFPLDHLEWY